MGDIAYETMEDYRARIRELEEENKKLQEKVNTYSEEYGKLRKENKKLKKTIKELEDACERYEIENNIETMGNPIDPKILE